MRIAIVDDLDAERAQLKERLVRQLRARGTEAELLEFETSSVFPPHFWTFTWKA